MKKIITALFICLLLSQFSFASKPKLTGFNNFTKWVDKGLKDKAISAKEVMNLDEFVLNEKGKFGFLVMLPPPDSFWDMKYKPLPGQKFRITAKDDDTGQEWIIIEAFCRRGKINWIEIKPIKGNITLTCTYLESDVERTLQYSYKPDEKDENQHLYNYLDKSQIEDFNTLSKEEIENTKKAKTLSFYTNVNIDQLTYMNFPIEKTIIELSKIAGLEYTKTNDDRAELKLYINIFGNSVYGKTRFYGKVNRTVDVTREVKLEGSVLLKTPENYFLARNIYRHKRFDILHYDSRSNQLTKQVINGYWDLYRFKPIIKEVSEILISALDLNPIDFYIKLSKSENANSSWWAINLMGNYQNDEGLAYLTDWYQKETGKRKSNALNAIGKMNSQKSLEFLRSEYKNDTAKNRPHVARLFFSSLIETKDENAMEIIAKAFTREADAIKIQAARALGKIGDEDCVKLLLSKLDESPKRVIENIVPALGKCKNEIASPKLISFLEGIKAKKEWKKSFRSKLTKLTIEALGEIGSIEAFPAIVPYMKDVYYKNKAYKALVNITGEDKGYKYKAWMEWWKANS